jgi:hypothetical protein
MNTLLLAILMASLPPADPPAQGVAVDAATKTVRVPCKIAPRKLPNLPEVYPIEVFATWPTPKGQKAHETVVVFDVLPSDVHKALEATGLKPGKPGRGDDPVSGPEVELALDLPASGNLPARQVRVETLLIDKKTGRPLPLVKWHFTGSALKDGKYAADTSGTLISLYPVTDEVVMQSSLTMKEEGMIKLETAKPLLPPEGTACTLIIRPPTPKPAPPGFDPESQVLKLSAQVGPGPAATPTSAPGGASAPAAASSDPYEQRREVKPGKGLADSPPSK